MFGLIPRLTLYSFVPIENSISTNASLLFTVFTICSFLIILNGRLNNTKQIASSKVDLPEPFVPIIKVVFDLVKSTSIGVLPVDRKFFQLIFLKIITW